MLLRPQQLLLLLLDFANHGSVNEAFGCRLLLCHLLLSGKLLVIFRIVAVWVVLTLREVAILVQVLQVLFPQKVTIGLTQLVYFLVQQFFALLVLWQVLVGIDLLEHFGPVRQLLARVLRQLLLYIHHLLYYPC